MAGDDNRWRSVWIPLVVALALAGCKKKRQEDSPPPPAPVVSPAAPTDAPADAALDPRIERVRGYVGLLVIDFWLYQVLESFPGSPTSGTFLALDYRWDVGDIATAQVLRETISRTAALAARSPSTPTDDAVRAYTDALVPALPALLELRDYYAQQHFIDDEFDRARREAPDIARLRDDLAKLRVPMRAAVLTAWQELSSDVPDSPRAVATAAWRKCMSVADPLMAHAKPPVIEAAMSACRRSVPTLAALPRTAGGGFAETVRGAAISIGDGVANSLIAHNMPNTLARFTDEYLELWPTLPNTPAEHVP